MNGVPMLFWTQAWLNFGPSDLQNRALAKAPCTFSYFHTFHRYVIQDTNAHTKTRSKLTSQSDQTFFVKVNDVGIMFGNIA